MSLSEAWEKESKLWIEWARKPGFDSFWKFHRDQFFQLLPKPGRLTVDVGCGEGRVSRELKKLGYTVEGFDSSPTLVEAAKEADPEGVYKVAGAHAIPIADASADLVVSHMVLHDVDDLAGSVQEMARIMSDSARACIAFVHPLNSAGNFADQQADSDFVIKGSYLDEFRYTDELERDGVKMTFHSAHRSLEMYSRAFESAGLLIEAIREHQIPESICTDDPKSRRWQRVPLFLHFRLRKAQAPELN